MRRLVVVLLVGLAILAAQAQNTAPAPFVLSKSLMAVRITNPEQQFTTFAPLLKMMDKAAESIAARNSVILFPEGTRSPDGNLHPYKTGAFKLALDARAPVLPIVIKGTHQAIRKGEMLVYRNDCIKLVILDPIPFESFSHLDARELSQLIHEKTRLELERNA